MKAIPKTATREVWQHTLREMEPLWVGECVEWHADGLYLVRRSGKQRIEVGDWLIRDLDGEPEWMDDADFTREYELS